MLFVCDAWESRRSRMNVLFGKAADPEYLISITLQSKEY